MTVSRVTEAVTASLYAHAADEKWEGDYFTQNLTGGCRDIAQQLIDEYKDIQASSGTNHTVYEIYRQVQGTNNTVYEMYRQVQGQTIQFMRYTGKFRDKSYSL